MSIKIDPIITTKVVNKFEKNITKPSVINSAESATKGLLVGAIASTGLIFSSKINDFLSTIEDNYFQLKTNPETNIPYQADVFQKAAAANLFLGNDVLVTAPTGTGKTAIAEYIITKNLTEGNKTYYTTPLKALSNEKFLAFQKTYGEENVGLITGDTKINVNAPIVIMTTEVYRNIVATEKFKFAKDKSKNLPENLKTVIFDELQYLGDVDRGGIWEQAIMFTPRDVQMLSLSATIGNNKDINNWIASTKGRKGLNITPNENYKPNWNGNNGAKETVLINVPSENRHVPLTFAVEEAAAEIRMPSKGTKKQRIQARQQSAVKSQSFYAQPNELAYKSITKKLKDEDKLPAIYFVFSKREGRHLLEYLSAQAEVLTTKEEQDEIKSIVNRYRQEGTYLGVSLDFDALAKGYAIHNAGLLPSQKRLVEELFQKKLVKVVVATETLSAGINMPAKTTVISTPRKPSSTSDGGSDHRRNLTPNEFHQMAGRAGRRGIDTKGYCSVISCNPEQKALWEELIEATSNPLESNLDLDYSLIANYLAEFVDDEVLERVLAKSLYAYNTDGTVNKNKLKDLMNIYHTKKQILEDDDFIKDDGSLTLKGELIKHLNGYEQIPIINILTSGVLDNLEPKQLAGVIGGLANIEYDEEINNGRYLNFYHDEDTMFINAAQETYEELLKYDYKIEKIDPDRQIGLNPHTMEHVYQWAELNENPDEESRKNWKMLYKGDLRFSIRDEGTLVKEINMTSDLLKQLIDICLVGSRLSQDPLESDRYSRLSENLRGALDLIQREPAEG